MDVKLRARENELEILKALANCGWLTTRQLAKWVWCESSIHVAINKASLVTGRLVKMNYILARESIAGPRAWVITHAGAAMLNNHLLVQGYSRGWAHHGYALSTLQWANQERLFERLLEKRHLGLAVAGKAGLRAGLGGSDYCGLDGLAVDIKNAGYRIGLLLVNNLNEATREKVKRYKRLCKLELIGEPRIVKGLSTEDIPRYR